VLGCGPGQAALRGGQGCRVERVGARSLQYQTPVWGGGIAFTDMMAFVPDGVVAVEAKVDEPFDNLVLDWICAEAANNDRSPPHRLEIVQRYAKAFNVPLRSLMDIRYQLLQGTLCAALRAKAHSRSSAWMVVQSFPKSVSNRADFDRFVQLVGSAPILEGISVALEWAQDENSALRESLHEG
jgi:hypothetical protein